MEHVTAAESDARLRAKLARVAYRAKLVAVWKSAMLLNALHVEAGHAFFLTKDSLAAVSAHFRHFALLNDAVVGVLSELVCSVSVDYGSRLGFFTFLHKV